MSELFQDLTRKSTKKRKTVPSVPEPQKLYLFSLHCNECEVFEFYPIGENTLTPGELTDVNLCSTHRTKIYFPHVRLAHALGHLCTRLPKHRAAIDEAFDDGDTRKEPLPVVNLTSQGNIRLTDFDLIVPIPVVLSSEWFEDE